MNDVSEHAEARLEMPIASRRDACARIVADMREQARQKLLPGIADIAEHYVLACAVISYDVCVPNPFDVSLSVLGRAPLPCTD